jgi:hypothetical protein
MVRRMPSLLARPSTRSASVVWRWTRGGGMPSIMHSSRTPAAPAGQCWQMPWDRGCYCGCCSRCRCCCCCCCRSRCRCCCCPTACCLFQLSAWKCSEWFAGAISASALFRRLPGPVQLRTREAGVGEIFRNTTQRQCLLTNRYVPIAYALSGGAVIAIQWEYPTLPLQRFRKADQPSASWTTDVVEGGALSARKDNVRS